MKTRNLTGRVFSLAVLSGVATASHGAGFQLLEQSASGLGNAYAGSAAIAENASTIYFNPAGMTYLPGVNVSGGATAIRPSFKFRDNGLSRGPLALGGAPSTSNGGDAGSWGVVPNAYMSWQINDRWFAGVGLGAPFGLKTEYEDDWAGRFHSREFEIRTININPSVAYKVNDYFSIGVGANWQRIDATYRLAQVVPVPGVGYMEGDAKVKMHGDAWGWNAGVIFQPTESTRIGLSYRSKIKHSASGGTDIELRGNEVGTGAAHASVDLPDTAVLSISHDLTPSWTLLGDVSWTGWSSIPRLDIESGGTINRTTSLDLRFRDTWRFALGANYRVNEKWTWKVGVAVDQSPVRSAEYRPTSLPDNNRLWLSTGVQYRHGANTTVDLGYTYLHLKDTPIDNGNVLTQGRVVGDYKSSGHIVGVQVSTRF